MGLINSKKRTDPRDEGAAPTSQKVDSIIGAGTVLDGDCETPGSLRVEGRVTGSIRAARLTVAADGWVGGDINAPANARAESIARIDGRVDGTVTAPRVEIGPRGSVGSGMRVHDAVVRGRVAGAIVTEHRLLLEETAVVEGDVTAQRLGLAEGGQVYGTIRIGARPDPIAEAAGRASASGRAAASSGGGRAAGERAGEQAGEPGGESGEGAAQPDDRAAAGADPT